MKTVILTTKRNGTQGLFCYELGHHGSLSHMTTLQAAEAHGFQDHKEAAAYIRRISKRSTSAGMSFEILTLEVV